jgi:adenylate cyclase
LALSQRRRNQLIVLAVGVPLAAAVGTLYSLLHDRGLASAAASGGVIGGALCAVLMSAQVFGGMARVRRGLRRIPAALYLLVVLTATVAVVLGALLLGQLSAWTLVGPAAVAPIELADILFSLAVSAVFIAVTELERMVGLDALAGIFTGRQLTPREERRVFLFADLVGATALAERIGDVAFYRYLDAVFCDLAEPVGRNRGQIYRFVGDEMIVTWRADRDPARAAARALACVRDCEAALAARRPWFEATFGAAPRLRYALHAGPVVTGKMGERRREIVFLGDTVNTAARLEEIARTGGRRVVASAAVIDALPRADGFRVEALPDADIRGRREQIPVYALAAAEAEAEADEAGGRG